MESESLNKAMKLVVDAIQYSDINMIDKYELLLNLSLFLDHYEEAIKHRFARVDTNEPNKPLNSHVDARKR